MKLHSPQFEKVLKRGIKARVKSSPALKREYRNAKKTVRSNPRIAWFLRPFWSYVLFMVVFNVVRITHNPVSGLSVITLWTFVSVSVFAQGLLMALFRANDLPALALLPISESTIFRWELEKFIKKSVLFSLLDQIAGFLALAFWSKFSPAQWILGVSFAFLSWAMLWGLTSLCAARLPKVPYPLITGSFFIFGFALFLGYKWLGHAFLDFVNSAAPILNLILPTGWVPSLFQLTLPDKNWLLAGLLLPVIAVVFTLKNSLGVLGRRLVFAEHTAPEVADQVPAAATGGIPPGEKTAQPKRLGVTAIEEIIQTRQFLVQEEPRGWFEERLWKWFTPHEKTLAEFSFPKGIQITRPWLLVLRNFLVTVMLGFTLRIIDETFGFWTFGIGIFITFLQCLAQIFANGTAFRTLFNSGIVIPMYAAYPVTFLDLSRTLLKLSIIQLPMFLVYGMASTVLVAHAIGFDVVDGMIAGFKASSLIFAGRFILLMLAFSGGSNDSSQARVRSLVLVFVVLLGALLFFGLGICSVVPDMFGILSWLLWLAAILDAYTLFRLYGWFHNRNWFDLMSVPRR